MVIKALLEGSIKGVGKFHKTSVFPCGIFQVMSGVNKEPNTPNYDLFRLALESTAKRLYPNYANCDVQMQKDWINYDRKQKEEYINSLSENQYNTLIQRLEENPELQNILMLELYEEEGA
jgi:ribonucleoside-triphosphate reductase